MRPTRAWTTRDLDPAAFEALAQGLPASKVWTLMLEVFAQRAARRTPRDIIDQWRRDGFVRPSPIDQRTLIALDGHVLAAAEAFEAVELSPLAPLGSSSVVALASQHKLVSASRGTEVVADPTNALALAVAERVRRDATRPVHLATCHRAVRAQAVPKLSGFAQHFRIFCLASGGPERADRGFLLEALALHIRTHLRALDRLSQHGYEFPERQVTLLAEPSHVAVAERLAAGLAGERVAHEPLTHRYYQGIRFRIDVRGTTGGAIPLIDGGAFDWLGTLASNRRLVFVASGMGTQLIAHAFRSGVGMP